MTYTYSYGDISHVHVFHTCQIKLHIILCILCVRKIMLPISKEEFPPFTKIPQQTPKDTIHTYIFKRYIPYMHTLNWGTEKKIKKNLF